MSAITGSPVKTVLAQFPEFLGEYYQHSPFAIEGYGSEPYRESIFNDNLTVSQLREPILDALSNYNPEFGRILAVLTPDFIRDTIDAMMTAKELPTLSESVAVDQAKVPEYSAAVVHAVLSPITSFRNTITFGENRSGIDIDINSIISFTEALMRNSAGYYVKEANTRAFMETVSFGDNRINIMVIEMLNKFLTYTKLIMDNAFDTDLVYGNENGADAYDNIIGRVQTRLRFILAHITDNPVYKVM